MRCAPLHRTERPGGRSQAPPASAPEERGGGGRSELRQCPGPGSATLHLPSPHQGQVVVAAAFTVAVIDWARVGAAESMAVWAPGLPTAQADPRGRPGERAMRPSCGGYVVSQSRTGVASLVRVPATCQRASSVLTGAIQWWSLSLLLPTPFPQI